MQGHGNRVDVLGLVRLIRFWRFGIFILVFSQVVRIHGWIKGRRGGESRLGHVEEGGFASCHSAWHEEASDVMHGMNMEGTPATD